jgi:hypothetical protein
MLPSVKFLSYDHWPLTIRGKMVKAKAWKVLGVLFEIFLGISASTHWVVTENGRVQSQVGKSTCVIFQ